MSGTRPCGCGAMKKGERKAGRGAQSKQKGNEMGGANTNEQTAEQSKESSRGRAWPGLAWLGRAEQYATSCQGAAPATLGQAPGAARQAHAPRPAALKFSGALGKALVVL